MKRRFLASKARQGDGLGYVDRPEMAMRDEPECLTAEEHALHIDPDSKRAAEQQQAFETAQRERERRLMTFDQRLAKAQLQAKARFIDISREVWVLRQMQNGGKKLRHMEPRLAMIERKVNR